MNNDIPASLERENNYWQSVGGHPPAGYQDTPRMATCGYCGADEERGDMHRCYNCTEHTCTGCHKDTGRCSYCGISDAEVRIMALED